MKKTKKFLSIFAILFVAIFALSCCFFAACGSKDDDDDTTIEDTTQDDGTTGGDEGGKGGDTGDSGTGEGGDSGTGEGGDTGDSGTGEGGDSGTGEGGDSGTGEGGDSGTVTYNEYTSVEALQTAIETAAAGSETLYAKLGGDAEGTFAGTLDKSLEITGDVVLDLAGQSITYTIPESYNGYGTYEENEKYETVYTIVVKEGASLTIEDSSATADNAGTGTIKLTGEVPSEKSPANWDDMKYSRRFAAIQSEGTLIIEAGNIVSNSVGIVVEGNETYNEDTGDVTGGYLYFHGGSIEAEQYSIFEGAGTNVVTYIDGGTVSGGRGICVDGDAYFGYDYTAEESGSNTRVWQNNAKTTLNVYEGAEIISEGRSAISTIGYANANSTYVNIYGGTIMGEDLSTLEEGDSSLSASSDFATVYIANGNLQISGEPEITGTYALSIKGGTSVISGGTFTSTGKGEGNFTDSDTKPNAYALSIVYYGPQPQGSVSGRENVENSLDVKVTGGKFIGDLMYDGNAATDGKTSSFSIYGGTFTTDPTNYKGGEYCEITQETIDTVPYYTVATTSAASINDFISADAFVGTNSLGKDDKLDGTSEYVIYGDDDENTASVGFYGSSSAKVAEKKRTTAEGIYFQYALQTGGKASYSSDTGAIENCVKITTTCACTITIYVLSTGSTERTLYLWNAGDSIGTTGATSIPAIVDGNYFEAQTITIGEAGTYYLGTTSGGFNFYGMTISSGT